ALGLAREAADEHGAQARVQRPRLGALGLEPGLEGVEIGQQQALEQLAAAQRRQRLELVARQRLEAAPRRGPQHLQVEAAGREPHLHVGARGDEAGGALDVEHRAQLGEAPAQRRARVVRHVPEQITQLLAPVRPPGDREVAEQRPRLARARQGALGGARADAELAESSDFEGRAGHWLLLEQDPAASGARPSTRPAAGAAMPTLIPTLATPGLTTPGP